MPTKGTVLDEIQWRSPQIVAEMGGIHSNTVLHYFSNSPFFEETSNNAVLTNQAFHNPGMYHLIQTREAFEGGLRAMTGLEYMVAQEPAEMGPGAGTGVWVVRKQTRQKRGPEMEDEVVVHASYFVVGENIYMAPTLGDLLISRINTITQALSKVLPAAEEARTWTPALGNVYNPPKQADDTAAKPADSKSNTLEAELQQLAEDSWFRHLKYGSDYLDERPITGQPGNFHIAAAVSKPPAVATGPPQPLKTNGIGGLGIPETAKEEKKGAGKADKSPKTPSMPKPKRRKSNKGGSAAQAS